MRCWKLLQPNGTVGAERSAPPVHHYLLAMPFTPAPAAAAPLIDRLVRPIGLALPMSALVIGTMTPDFEYLVRLSPAGGRWHPPAGLVEYCLPAGLVSWWMFRTVISPALVRLLPPGLGTAAADRVAPGPTWHLLPAAALAILLGALSHGAWDSFTHESHWGVREFPALNTPVSLGHAGMTPWYAILQYASSVVGIAVVVAVLWHWVAKQPPAARTIPPGQLAWRLRELGILVLVTIASAVANAARGAGHGLTWTLGLAAVGGMSALVVAVLVYGVVGKVRARDGHPLRRSGN